jgi:hypothetical protein
MGIGPPGDEEVFASWDSINTVQCAAEPDPDGGSARDVLIVSFVDSAGLPAEPWGAAWQGNRLLIDAEGWDTPIEEVSIHAETAIEHARRLEPEDVPDDD